MKRLGAAILLALIHLALPLTQAIGMEFIALSHPENRLYRLSIPLTAPTPIGEADLGADPVELIEADAVRLYTFDRASNTVIVLDRFSLEVLGTSPLDQDLRVTRRGFDLSPTGVLYGVLPGMELRIVDPLSGATSFVAEITGAARVEAIAFAADGILYAIGSKNDNYTSKTLFTLSTETGELKETGALAVDDLDDLAFGPDGVLYGVDSKAGIDTHLLRINPTTAAVTDLGATGVTSITGLVAVRQTVSLSIARQENSVVLSWPANALGFRLERSASLEPASWLIESVAPSIIGNEKRVIISPEAAAPGYFRLARSAP